MKITEVFTDEIAKIQEVVNNMPMENCISNFDKYIDSSSFEGATDFEQKYIQKLRYHLGEFVVEIFMKKHKGKDREQLLEEIKREYMGQGYGDITSWAYNAWAYNAGMGDIFCMEDIFWKYSDSELYESIKEYMRNTLEVVRKELLKTKNEKEAERLRKTIEQSENSVKNTLESIEKMKAQLANLEA